MHGDPADPAPQDHALGGPVGEDGFGSDPEQVAELLVVGLHQPGDEPEVAVEGGTDESPAVSLKLLVLEPLDPRAPAIQTARADGWGDPAEVERPKNGLDDIRVFFDELEQAVARLRRGDAVHWADDHGTCLHPDGRREQ